MNAPFSMDEETCTQIECPECYGSGIVLVQLNGWSGDPLADYDEEDCPECGGTGQVEVWE